METRHTLSNVASSSDISLVRVIIRFPWSNFHVELEGNFDRSPKLCEMSSVCYHYYYDDDYYCNY